MPELPEVEIVRRSLNKIIRQKKVLKVIIRNRNLRTKIPNNFKKFFLNKKIIKVSRFSKYLIVCLPNNEFCIIHLGMSGTIHSTGNKIKSNLTNLSFYNFPYLPKKHNHIEFVFDNTKIIYNDPRRFGFFQIIKNTKDLKKRFEHLGPEPFSNRFNLEYFQKFIERKSKTVKDLLIDQKFVSGIGNIYANEILFLSGINPKKKIKFLNKEHCSKIIIYSKKVILDAIKQGGSSIRDFKNTNGNQGSFQDNFKVYQRNGQICKKTNCNGEIIKKVITNRSSYFCNTCQN